MVCAPGMTLNRTPCSANCPTANRQVAYHIDKSTPRTLFGDAQRLQQILLNILNNAIKVRRC